MVDNDDALDDDVAAESTSSKRRQSLAAAAAAAAAFHYSGHRSSSSSPSRPTSVEAVQQTFAIQSSSLRRQQMQYSEYSVTVISPSHLQLDYTCASH